MDGSTLLPHSCRRCQKIIIDGTIAIDGTGPTVDQSFEYTLRDVQAYAEECKLFKWSLRFQTATLQATDNLTLSISEDLTYFEAQWRNSRGDNEQSSLHIFAERGTYL